MMEKISVIVPIYNEANIVSDTLNHLSKIDYPDKEIILGIEPSNDKTVEICQKLEGDYPQFRFIYNKSRLGFAKNVSNLSKLSKGTIIFKLDCDYRLYHPEKALYKTNEIFKDKRVGGISYFAGNNPKQGKTLIARGELFANKLITDFRKSFYPIKNLTINSFSTQIWRKNLININTEDVFLFDDEVGINLIKRGYILEEDNLCDVYYVGFPQTIKNLKTQKVREMVGWMRLSNKHNINLKKYYLGIIIYSLKNMYKYNIMDIISFMVWCGVVGYSTLLAYIKRKQTPIKLWDKFERMI